MVMEDAAGSKRKDPPSDYSSSEGDLDSDEDEELAIRDAYERHLPQVRAQIGQSGASLKDMETKICLVCRARVTGWVGLLAHAKTFKKKLVVRHRGYHKALQEVIEPQAQERGNRVELSEARVDATALLQQHKKMVWPPMVLMDCCDTEQVRNFIEESVIDRIELVSEGILVVCKKIPLTLTVLQCLNESCHLLHPQDMERIDPDRIIVGWCAVTLDEATGIMKGLNLDEDKRAENIQARKLQSWKLEVAHGKTISEASNLESMLKSREDKLMELRQKTPVLDTLEALQMELQGKLQRFEETLAEKEKESAFQVLCRKARITARRKEAAAQKERLEKLLQKESKQESKNMERLRCEQEKEEQKRKEKMQQMESDYQAKELKLIADQEKELKQLQEAMERELDDFVNEKKHPQQGKSTPEECIVCLMEFSKKRQPAVIVPCGHCTTCTSCCAAIWKAKPRVPARCPVCRQEMDSKPEAAFA